MVWRHFEQCTYVIIIEVIHVTVAYHTSNYVEYVRQVLLTMKWRHFENMRARHNENIMSVFFRLCLNRRVCDAWCVSHTVRVPLMWLGGPDAGPVLVIEISGWTRNVCNKFQRHKRENKVLRSCHWSFIDFFLPFGVSLVTALWVWFILADQLM